MKKISVRKTVTAALLVAVVCIATVAIPIPLPGGGYANLGDTLVLLGVYFFGPICGIVGAAVGSALADTLLGYTLYIPATFVIKGLMAAIFFLFVKGVSKKELRLFSVGLGAFFAEAIMVGMYFLFECLIYSPSGAVLGVWGNCVQGAVSVVLTVVLAGLFSKSRVRGMLKIY